MKIFIAGHNGMAGSAIYRNLSKLEDNTIVCSARAKLDLLDQNQVADFMSTEKPDIVIIAAAKVGGILANNDFPYQFLMENMQIQNNLID